MPNIKKGIILYLSLLLASVVSAQNNALTIMGEATYNFGTIVEADGPRSHTFTVKNAGKDPLVITRITASCGCTQPEWTKEPIAPGKTGTVKVTFDPKGRPGPFQKTIAIYHNGRKDSYTLTIKGSVNPKATSPLFSYPYSIGDLKLHTKNILFSSIRPDETLSEQINLMNDTQELLSIQIGKLPNYLQVDASSFTLLPGETSDIKISMDAAAAKRKGRVSTEIPVIISSSGKKETTGYIQVAANIIDNFSKMTASEKAQAPVADLSGTLLEFGQISEKSSIIPLIGGALISAKVSGNIDITNTGKSTLYIYSITSDDERLDISGGKRELKPGATTTFKISIHPKDIKVKLEALVNIVCNDPNGPVRLIKVTAYK